jgi:lipoprotein signal peptidase
MVGVIWLDLWSKHKIFSTLASGEVYTAVPGTFQFRRSLNDGAVFGSFTGYVSVFIVASIAAAGFVLYMFGMSKRTQRVLHFGLALILAGALGNLYDRAYSIADVVTYRQDSGGEASVIGLITNDPNDPVIRIGDWPDGAHARSFQRDEVTVKRQGVVRDFIKFIPKFPDWFPYLAGRDMWPWIFNIADSALVCGFALVLLSNWWDKPRVAEAEPEANAAMVS